MILKTEQATILYRQLDRQASYDVTKNGMITTGVIIKIALKAVRNPIVKNRLVMRNWLVFRYLQFKVTTYFVKIEYSSKDRE